MTRTRAFAARHLPAEVRGRCVLPLLVLALLLAGGCQPAGHTSDPQLRKVDLILDPHLPKGTTMNRVISFLSSRGYPLENSRDPHAIVAVVRHIDTATLQPITARVTFHFDEHDKLVTYELAPGQDSPLGH
jgi:hypothetical protein